jgi:hypothetical protein
VGGARPSGVPGFHVTAGMGGDEVGLAEFSHFV